MPIDEIIDGLLTDFSNNHYWEMYEIIPYSKVHDGLWVCIDEDDEAGNMVLRFDYNDEETEVEWVTCAPNADVIRTHIENAKRKFEEMYGSNVIEQSFAAIEPQENTNDQCPFCPKFTGGKVACASEEDAMNSNKQNYQYIDIKFCPVCGRRLRE